MDRSWTHMLTFLETRRQRGFSDTQQKMARIACSPNRGYISEDWYAERRRKKRLAENQRAVKKLRWYTG